MLRGIERGEERESLTTRPWVTNIYLMSGINFRLCAFNFRQQDIQIIHAATKSWITQGYLLKPNELLLHREPADGGLGLIHAASRCQANLIKNFISQGDPRSDHSNSYLITLFRSFVSQEFPEDTILLHRVLLHNDQGGVGGEGSSSTSPPGSGRRSSWRGASPMCRSSMAYRS